MGLIDVPRRYFEAWNRRDPAAIVAVFADAGTYRDPIVPDGLTGPAGATLSTSKKRSGKPANRPLA